MSEIADTLIQFVRAIAWIVFFFASIHVGIWLAMFIPEEPLWSGILKLPAMVIVVYACLVFGGKIDDRIFK